MMKVELTLDENKKGIFFIQEQGKKIAEMEIVISGNNLIVSHTEVVPEMEGRGLARELLLVMVEYVRQHKLKVIPLCPYVLAQFKRQPEQYVDIWKKTTV